MSETKSEFSCPRCNGVGCIPAEAMLLGDVLRHARHMKRLSIEAVEEATTISRNYIANVETNKNRNPSFTYIVLLAELYGLDIGHLAIAAKRKSP